MSFLKCNLLVIFLAFAFTNQAQKAVIPHTSPVIKFTENLGQWKEVVLFKAMIPGGAMFIERDGVTYSFYDHAKLRRMHTGSIMKGVDKDFTLKGHLYKMKFVDANPAAQVDKRQQNADYENFFLDNDPSKWKSNVKSYRQIFLRDIYPGIDYELLAAANSAKYNFYVKPGADPSGIRMRYDGAEQLSVKNNRLFVKSSVNLLTEEKPYAWQNINGEIKEVKCHFVLRDNVVSFSFPQGYDKNHELVIDPVLVFSAQIGTAADNFGMTATFDPQGNLYSAGVVYDPGYPTTLGAFDNTMNNQQEYGRTDVFVTKYNAAGNALVFSTYLGGSGTDVCSSLIIDLNGNLCLYGATGSADFPMGGSGAFKSFSGGNNFSFISNGCCFLNGSDIYICKFNSSGTTLLASTFFGGSGNDGINYLGAANAITYNLFPAPGQGTTYTCGYDSLLSNYGDQFRGEIQIDSLNNIYVCSSTRSSNIPLMNAFDGSLGGKQDAVVMKFNSSLSTLLFSSYLGGSSLDCGNAIFVTPTQEIYVTGGTCSNDFPGTLSAHSPTYNGGKSDGYITRIASNGNLLQSTYIGTNLYDNSFFVQCDKYGDVYVYGQSLGNLPVKAKANLPLYSVPNTHQFIRCYNNALTSLNMSTVFGSKTNTFDISPSAFAIDQCNGNIYLSGWGGSVLEPSFSPGMSGMPLLNPTQSSTTGFDFYLMALKPHASALLYGSYFGGSSSREHVDGGTSRFDRKGIIYQSVCAGCGGGDDFPITNGAWPCPGSPNCQNPNQSLNCNNGVFKINFDLQEAVASISTQHTVGCAPLTATLINTFPGTSYKWDLGNGDTTSVIPNPVVTFSNAGTYTVSLLVRDTTMCITEDTQVLTFSVYAIPQPTIQLNNPPCQRSISANALLGNDMVIENWDFGNNQTYTNVSINHNFQEDGIYTLTLSVTNKPYGCKGITTATVSAVQFDPQAAGGGTLCQGESLSLYASGGTSYSWNPPGEVQSPLSGTTSASPSIPTIYTVNIVKELFGQTCTSQHTVLADAKPIPTTDFDYTVHPCGGSVTFEDKSFSDISKWFWTFSSGDTTSSRNPRYYFDTGGTKYARLETTNIFGCRSTTEKIFNVGEADVGISGPVNICLGQTTQLTASGGYEYQWLPEFSVEQPYAPVTIAHPSVTTEYSVIIGTSVTNTVTGGLCEFTLTTLVTVSELSRVLPVSASAQPSVLIQGNNTQLVYTGDPGATVTWYPFNSTSPATGYTVTAMPDKPTTYTVVAQRDACRSDIIVDVVVYSNKCLQKDVFVPNTFTPNGDGYNDIFKVHGVSVDEVYFAVYNRWGELVFETTDKNAGWNGRYMNRDADAGVFGWYLKVKCHNGEETFLKGNVTLIR